MCITRRAIHLDPPSPPQHAACTLTGHAGSPPFEFALLVVLRLVVLLLSISCAAGRDRRAERRRARRLLLGDGRLALLEAPLGLLLELSRRLVRLLGRRGRVSTDSGVYLLDEGRVALGVQPGVDVLGEALLERLRILLHEQLHVLGDVLALDAVGVRLGVELLRVAVVAGEALLVVRDVKATVSCALHRTEDAGARCGGADTDIEHAAERLALLCDGRHVELPLAPRALALLLSLDNFAVDLGVALIQLSEAELSEHAARDEQACSVRSGVVLEADLEAVALELRGVGCRDDAVALDLRVDDLADDVVVREAHH